MGEQPEVRHPSSKYVVSILPVPKLTRANQVVEYLRNDLEHASHLVALVSGAGLPKSVDTLSCDLVAIGHALADLIETGAMPEIVDEAPQGARSDLVAEILERENVVGVSMFHDALAYLARGEAA